MFHYDLDLHQSTALMRRIQQLPAGTTLVPSDQCGPAVLSPVLLCARIHYLFALSQLESLLISQGATKILAEAMLASRASGDCNVMQVLMGLTRDEIHADLCGAVGGVADCVSTELAEIKKAAEIDSTDGSSKFVGDDDMSTAIEGKYESESVFHEGQDKYIGLLDPKVLSAIVNEHQNAADWDIPYVTSNYNLTCMPWEELEVVLFRKAGKNYPGMGTGKGKRELPPLRVYLSAAGCLDRYQPMGKEVGIEHVVGKDVAYATDINRYQLGVSTVGGFVCSSRAG